MANIFKIFLMDLIGEAGSVLDMAINNILNLVFHLEMAIQDSIDVFQFSMDQVLTVTYTFGMALLILKCLKKGFEQYILWTDGDADTPPVEMLYKIGKAVAIAACFPTLYEYLVDISVALTDKLLAAASLPAQRELKIGEVIAHSVINASSSLLMVLFVFIYLILCCVMIYQFIKKGVEMLILRMGVPIGVIGFVDSDQGFSKTYFRIFYQCALTVIIQTFALKLSISIWLSSDHWFAMIVAIVLMAFAASASKFLSQFLVASGGGSAASSIYFASSALSRVSSLIHKK